MLPKWPVWLCVGEGEDEASRHRRLYPKVLSYAVPDRTVFPNGWYQEEDYMDPIKVASSVCRVGKPNLDGSIGGHKGYPLLPRREGRDYSHYQWELARRVIYPCTQGTRWVSTHQSPSRNVLHGKSTNTRNAWVIGTGSRQLKIVNSYLLPRQAW